MTAYLKWVQAWSSIVDKRTCKLRGRGGRRRRLYNGFFQKKVLTCLSGLFRQILHLPHSFVFPPLFVYIIKFYELIRCVNMSFIFVRKVW
ncbi:unnamed protein product [Brassica oleracea var. botrytis]